jgi:hypothetical protein
VAATAFPCSLLTFSTLAIVALLSFKIFLDLGVAREEQLLFKTATCMPAINKSHDYVENKNFGVAFSSGRVQIKNLICWKALNVSFLETEANIPVHWR